MGGVGFLSLSLSSQIPSHSALSITRGRSVIVGVVVL
jgi:hypothetical protein